MTPGGYGQPPHPMQGYHAQAPGPGTPQQGWAPQAPGTPPQQQQVLDFKAMLAAPPLAPVRIGRAYEREGMPERFELDFGILRGASCKTVEKRRLELTSAALRRVKLAAGKPVRVRAGLVELCGQYGRRDGPMTHEGGWHITNYKDVWLWIQGELADGVGFELTRTEFQHQREHSTRRGNYRHIRTERTNRWEQRLLLRFPPGRFERMAREGARRELLVLPEGFQLRYLNGAPDGCELVLGCEFKWDAAGPGQKLDGLDAVKAIGVLFLNLYLQLGARDAVPFITEEASMRPPQYFQVPLDAMADRTFKERKGAYVPSLVAFIFAAFCGLFALLSFNEWSEQEGRIDRYQRSLKTETKSEQERYRRWIAEAEEKAMIAGIQGGVGGGLGLLGVAIGGILFLNGRKKQRAANEAWQRRLDAIP